MKTVEKGKKKRKRTEKRRRMRKMIEAIASRESFIVGFSFIILIRSQSHYLPSYQSAFNETQKCVLYLDIVIFSD